jgi:hypothetical protein
MPFPRAPRRMCYANANIYSVALSRYKRVEFLGYHQTNIRFRLMKKLAVFLAIFATVQAVAAAHIVVNEECQAICAASTKEGTLRGN